MDTAEDTSEHSPEKAGVKVAEFGSQGIEFVTMGMFIIGKASFIAFQVEPVLFWSNTSSTIFPLFSHHKQLATGESLKLHEFAMPSGRESTSMKSFCSRLAILPHVFDVAPPIR